MSRNESDVCVDSDVCVEVVGPDRLPTCHDIRRIVFVQGQNVPEALEIDGLDGECVHFLASCRGRPVGSARLRNAEGLAKAERVAVLSEYRDAGIGRALMHALEAHAQADGFSEVLLHAQQEVISFYQRLGYRGEGDLFEEAGITHRVMRKRLSLA